MTHYILTTLSCWENKNHQISENQQQLWEWKGKGKKPDPNLEYLPECHTQMTNAELVIHEQALMQTEKVPEDI